MSEDKKYTFFMFCYQWTANNQQGRGSKILSNDNDFLISKDIGEASSVCAEFVGQQMNHDKDSVKIIFTNIIKLNHCTQDEFYKTD